MSSPRPVAPPAVRWITRELQDAGHETWAVGGAVRDALIGQPSGDWDLTTHARPDEVQALFRRTVPIGVEHGTVGVLARDGTMFEVTTFRRDVDTDGRHAVVSFAETVHEDLARRDFTINAIAWHPLREELLDPFRGLADLRSGTLRTVGAPEERFAEDYLRILRAFRFASRFGLLVEDETWTAIESAVGNLSGLSAERKREELLKTLDADPRPSRALELYRRSGALAVLYPELQALCHDSGEPCPEGGGAKDGPGADEDVWEMTLGCVDQLPMGRPHLRLAGLLRPLGAEPCAQVLTRLRLSNVQVDEIARRCGAQPLPDAQEPDATFRRWLSVTGPGRLAAIARLDLAGARHRSARRHEKSTGGGEPEGVDLGPKAVVASWRRARAARASGAPLTVSELAIDGRDLIRLGLQPGPQFGAILDQLLDLVLLDPERNEAAVLEREVERITGGAPGV